VKYERRKWMTGTLVAACLIAAATRAGGVVPAKDLQRESVEAERNCKPLLLEFASTSCSYCSLLEAEVLNPTLLNRDYDRRVLMRKLIIDNAARLTDFDGTGQVNAQQLARRYKVTVTPSLLFVDSRGQELAERMVGVTTLELYGGYLDIALDVSRERLRARERCED
jgi:thioredoxin-related protein